MKTIYAILILLFISSSCQKSADSDGIISKEVIEGSVQKGPFLNGTSIEIIELNAAYKQTGKVFSTQTNNNKGSFTIHDIDLVSQYVELQANGFYFNEVIGKNSSAQLSLSALTDLADSSTVNINIFSTLEKKRVEFLLETGKSFKESKIQARAEILSIFNIDKADMVSPEYLDISKNGDDNAILLAISLIIQGYRTESELTELIANMSEDLRADGMLDNGLLGSSLLNHAKVLDTASIRQNLRQKYNSLGEIVVVPGFEKYVTTFVDSSGFVFTDIVQYPDSGKSGPNLLSYNQFDYSEQVSEYPNFKTSIVAHVPMLSEIKVIMKFDTPDTWGIDNTNSGWIIESTDWTIGPNVIIFTKDYSREDLDLKIGLLGTGSAKIEIYENKNASPIRMKDIIW
jgi:hypothetical protein